MLGKNVLTIDKLNNSEKVMQDILERTNYAFNGIMALQPHAIIDLLEIQLTEHCNLNCRGCSHFCPLAEAEFLDIKIFENDFRQLSKITNGTIGIIHLMGGEPLLHPEIIRIMETARTCFPDTVIKIVTNGILLVGKDDEFWKSASQYKIWITPTKYPIDIPWIEISEKAKRHNVTFEFFNNGDASKSLFHFPLDVNGTQSSLLSFIHCSQHYSYRRCVQLVNGKIFLCPAAPYSRHFSHYFSVNLDICKRDYIDIYETEDIQDILSYLAKPVPFCRYCNTFARSYGHTWQTSKKMMEEWT
jgi:hypothetical protein